MADEQLAEAMLDQPGVAVLALQAQPTGAAERKWRVAAPVEKEERLFAPFQRDLHRFGEPWRNEAAARRPFAAEINGFHRGRLLPPEPLRQRKPLIAAAAGVHFGLDRRRGGGKH